ncbi:Chromatin associated protein KTI12 [Shimia sp. SK013]|uniref:AAA family ATPase n=1 Tax=Shimia sp. SK013 TaxID=1389006 RepID=UPI0006B47017|nr:ATP-binding protein [Shimia sp. SK013]KPA21525.1 Chromatin associated protein KTI12 [Shimia sp. SK013]
MMNQTATLHVLCGKPAAGKSTLCAQLSRAAGAVVISEDAWLATLFGDQMSSIADFVRCSQRVREVAGPHVVDLLKAGVTVVLDFQANTLESRAWMAGLARQAQVQATVHHLDVPDEVCKARLRERNAKGSHPFSVSEAQFDQLAQHFVAPTDEEGLEVVVHSAV